MDTQNKCYYCGGEEFVERRIEYIYSRGKKSLLVPDMPVDVCLSCGMVFYHGDALLRVEERFKGIYEHDEAPDRYATLPVMDYA
ncbi:YgiT-type zinc finger protein [Promineifilum sp.]|uniref:YgiT-type zinc finger protein n=1 Tax=Promineifilum sp. TaxID=2664178 RepID=UPI0035B27ABB